MTKITIETETIETDLTPSEAAAKIKEALGIAEWPQIGDWYWYVDSRGKDMQTEWHNAHAEHTGAIIKAAENLTDAIENSKRTINHRTQVTDVYFEMESALTELKAALEGK